MSSLDNDERPMTPGSRPGSGAPLTAEERAAKLERKASRAAQRAAKEARRAARTASSTSPMPSPLPSATPDAPFTSLAPAPTLLVVEAGSTRPTSADVGSDNSATGRPGTPKQLTPEERAAKLERKASRAAQRAVKEERRAARSPSIDLNTSLTPQLASPTALPPVVEVANEPPASQVVTKPLVAVAAPVAAYVPAGVSTSAPPPAQTTILAASRMDVTRPTALKVDANADANAPIRMVSGGGTLTTPPFPTTSPSLDPQNGSPSSFAFASPMPVKRATAGGVPSEFALGPAAQTPLSPNNRTTLRMKSRAMSDVDLSTLTAEELAAMAVKDAQYLEEQTEVESLGKLLTLSAQTLEYNPQVRKVKAARLVPTQQETINEEEDEENASKDEETRPVKLMHTRLSSLTFGSPSMRPISASVSGSQPQAQQQSAVATLPIVRTFKLANDGPCDMCVLLVPESTCFQVQTPQPLFLRWQESVEVIVALVDLPLADPLGRQTFQLKLRAKRVTESQMASHSPAAFWNATKRRPYARRMVQLIYAPIEASTDVRARTREAERRRELVQTAVHKDFARAGELLATERALAQTEARKNRHLQQLEALAAAEAEREARDAQAREDHTRMQASTKAWLTAEAAARERAVRERRAAIAAAKAASQAPTSPRDPNAALAQIDNNASLAWVAENADAFRPLSNHSNNKQTPLWGLAACAQDYEEDEDGPVTRAMRDAASPTRKGRSRAPISPVESQHASVVSSGQNSARRSSKETPTKARSPARRRTDSSMRTPARRSYDTEEKQESSFMSPYAQQQAQPRPSKRSSSDMPLSPSGVNWNDIAFGAKKARGHVDFAYHFLASLTPSPAPTAGNSPGRSHTLSPSIDVTLATGGLLDGILLPDTVVIRSGVPQAYFYTGASCSVREKAWAKISSTKALGRFEPSRVQGPLIDQESDNSGVVAVMLAAPQGDAKSKGPEYLPYDTVAALLRSSPDEESKPPSSEANIILQQFVRPVAAAVHHEQYRAAWSTAGFSLKRRTAVREYFDLTVPLRERLVRWDCPAGETHGVLEEAVVAGPVFRRFSRVLESLAAHMAISAALHHLRPVKLAMVFQRGVGPSSDAGTPAPDAWYLLACDVATFGNLFGAAIEHDADTPIVHANFAPYSHSAASSSHHRNSSPNRVLSGIIIGKRNSSPLRTRSPHRTSSPSRKGATTSAENLGPLVRPHIRSSSSVGSLEARLALSDQPRSCVKCHDPARDSGVLPLITVLQRWTPNIFYRTSADLVAALSNGSQQQAASRDEFWAQRKQVVLCEACLADVHSHDTKPTKDTKPQAEKVDKNRGAPHSYSAPLFMPGSPYSAQA